MEEGFFNMSHRLRTGMAGVLFILFFWSLFAWLQQTDSVSRKRVELKNSAFLPEASGSFAFQYVPVPVEAGSGDLVSQPTASALELLEDGRPLLASHSLHTQIREKGQGRYSHWGSSLIMSTSDNSDPRINGRTYEVSIPTATPQRGMQFLYPVISCGSLLLLGGWWPAFGRCLTFTVLPGSFLGLTAFIILFIVLGPLRSHCWPGQTLYWTNGGRFVTRLIPQIPTWILLWCMSGALIGWIHRFTGSVRDNHLWNVGELTCEKRSRRWGMLLVMLLCLFPLFRQWTGMAPKIHAHDMTYFAFMGFVPYSDANSYVSGAYHLLLQGTVDEWNERRPLNAAFLAVRLALTGMRLHLATILQALFLGVGMFLVSQTVGLFYGWWSGSACLAILLALGQCCLGTCLSESLGMTLGAIGIGLILRAFHSGNPWSLFLGSMGFALSLSARAGAFFILPLLLAASLLPIRSFPRRSIFLVLLLTGITAGFLLNWGILYKYSNSKNRFNSNFSYVICGIAENSSWITIKQKYWEQLLKLPNEKARAAFLYARSWEALAQDPWVVLKYSHRAYSQFQADFLPYLKAVLFEPAIRHSPSATLLLYFVVFSSFLRFGRSLFQPGFPGERRFWLIFWVGIFLSIPVIHLDGGWRVWASTWPITGGFFALGCFSPLTARRFQTPANPSARLSHALIIGFVVSTLFGPWLGHVVWGMRERTPYQGKWRFDQQSLAAVSVVDDLENLHPHPDCPVVASSSFLSLPLSSWTFPPITSPVTLPPFPQLLGIGYDTHTGLFTSFFTSSLFEDPQVFMTQDFLENPRERLGPFRILTPLPTVSGNLPPFPVSNPDSPADGLHDICSWMSQRVVFGDADHTLFHSKDSRRGREGIRWKLFNSPQPLQLYCYQESFLVADVLRDCGYQTRLVHFQYDHQPASMSVNRFTEHWALEARWPAATRWILLDPMMGIFGTVQTRQSGNSELRQLLSISPSVLIPPREMQKPNLLSWHCPLHLSRLAQSSCNPLLSPAMLGQSILQSLDYGVFLGQSLRQIEWYSIGSWCQIQKIDELVLPLKR